MAGVAVEEDSAKVADPSQAPWFSEFERRSHFRKHGQKLGTDAIETYDASARGTIRAGRRFTYRQPITGERRVGYYHRPTQRFTVMTDDEATIVSHFVCPERYVRRLPDSDYQRS